MKYFIMLSTLLLAACQSEESCYNKNNKSLGDSAIIRGEGLFLVEVYFNESTSACDYTVLGGSLHKL